MNKKTEIILVSSFIVLIIICFVCFYYCVNYINFSKIAMKLVNDNNKENNKENYKLFTGSSKYRIADMVLYSGWRNEKNGKNFHYEHFPNSIASEYMKNTTKSNDIILLQKIIDRRTICKPPSDSLVIHLRVGDVIEESSHTVSQMLSRQIYFIPGKLWSDYVKPLKYFNDKINSIKKYNIKNIIIIAGSHKKYNFKKSTLYINCIKKFLEDKKFNVRLMLGNNPDNDLIFMSNAKYLITSGGGYSKIIKRLVKNRRNVII